MKAIGIEISADLAEVARRRAELLGVADRFEVVVQDAAGFDRPACADTAFWSQFFFPESARAGALAALHRALRPGGVLIATLDGDETADPTSADARDAAVMRVALASWGVPPRTAEQLVAEIEAAGFTDVTVARRDGLPRVRAIRP
jgi:SAM-dependent methyltransferase